MTIDLEQLKRLFLAALELPDEASRMAFVRAEAADNLELRSRLEAMLEVHADPLVDMERPLGNWAWEAALSSQPLEHRDQILGGRYQLLEHLGEGGMGSVWIAEQTQPVRRKVAIKLIKAGMDTRLVLSRFEVERQALALMDHPGIAKVFDGGMTETGRPYFVMEYVEGLPITRFCDEKCLNIESRLRLFSAVCQAVQHAHQKGIIHRDLKPNNILVSEQDGQPAPKIIDFGLAKAIDHRLSEHSLQTAVGTMLGTPLYMSPEQAATNNLDLDTRTDVYSLGVILYELLTGTTPLEREQFRQAAWQEMMHLIREREPPRPSDRLSKSDSLPSVAALRHIEPNRLTRLIKGDLDWIVMKTLEKDRNRRYDSAQSLASDVLRYLAGDSVNAHPPQLSYRLRKLVRRHLWQFSAAFLVVSALCAGLIGAVYGFWQARAREEIAIRLAETERDSRQEMEKRLRQLQASNEILSSVFHDIDVNQTADVDLKVKLGENLKAAAAKIEAEAIGDPFTVAELQVSLATSLQGLAHYSEAIDLATKASETFVRVLGPDDPVTLKAQRLLATSLHDVGEIDKACRLYETIYNQRKSKLGPNHLDTLISLADWAAGERAKGKFDSAVLRFDQAWNAMQTTLGPRHPETVRTLSRLAVARHLADQLDLALPLYQQALEVSREVFGKEHPETIRALSNLAYGMRDKPDLPQALILYCQAIELAQRQLGANHPESLRLAVNLGGIYQAQGEFETAIGHYRDLLPKFKERLGSEHPYTMNCLASLGSCLGFAGRPKEALPFLEDCWRTRTKVLGENHPETVASLVDLAWCHAGLGQHEAALPLFQQAMEYRAREFGPDDTSTLMSQCEYGQSLAHNARYSEAIQTLESTFDRTRSKLGADHPNSVYCQGILGLALRDSGKLSAARTILEDAVGRVDAAFGPESPDAFRVHVCLAECLRMSGNLDDALPLARKIHQRVLQKLGVAHPDVREAAVCLGCCLRDVDQHVEAVQLLEQNLSQVVEKFDAGSAEVLESSALLAEALRRSGDVDRARRLMEHATNVAGQSFGEKNQVTARCWDIRARCLVDLSEFESAISNFQKVLKSRESRFGRKDWRSADTLGRIGICYLKQNRIDLAQSHLAEAYEIAKEGNPIESIGFGLALLDCRWRSNEQSLPISPENRRIANELASHVRNSRLRNQIRRADELEEIANYLFKNSEFAEAAGLFRESIAIREAQTPRDWRTFRAQVLAGSCLARQKLFAEAEGLLLAGHSGLISVEQSLPLPERNRELVNATQAIVELYEAWEKPESLQEWRTKLSEPKKSVGETDRRP